MQSEWIIPVIFGLGFLAGYLARAMMSRRRRRRFLAERRLQEAEQNTLRFERPPRQDALTHSNGALHSSSALRSTDDAPALAATEFATRGADCGRDGAARPRGGRPLV